MENEQKENRFITHIRKYLGPYGMGAAFVVGLGISAVRVGIAEYTEEEPLASEHSQEEEPPTSAHSPEKGLYVIENINKIIGERDALDKMLREECADVKPDVNDPDVTDTRVEWYKLCLQKHRNTLNNVTPQYQTNLAIVGTERDTAITQRNLLDSLFLAVGCSWSAPEDETDWDARVARYKTCLYHLKTVHKTTPKTETASPPTPKEGASERKTQQQSTEVRPWNYVPIDNEPMVSKGPNLGEILNTAYSARKNGDNKTFCSTLQLYKEAGGTENDTTPYISSDGKTITGKELIEAGRLRQCK